jgi:hypothetical protein
MAVCFLAWRWARHPLLEPSYREAEFEFYLDDLPSARLDRPRGSRVASDRRGTKARNFRSFGFIERSKTRPECSASRCAGVGAVAPTMAELDDEALIMHTSGTAARPKMVH